jgi:starch phosphorylase
MTQIIQGLFPNLPQRLIGLGEIAENLWWSWHPAARMLFKTLSRQGWKDSGHNPDKMLRELPKEVLESAANDPDFLRRYDAVLSKFRKEIEEEKCNMPDIGAYADSPMVAYFSAEYGLHRSLPFYAVSGRLYPSDHE